MFKSKESKAATALVESFELWRGALIQRDDFQDGMGIHRANGVLAACELAEMFQLAIRQLYLDAPERHRFFEAVTTRVENGSKAIVDRLYFNYMIGPPNGISRLGEMRLHTWSSIGALRIAELTTANHPLRDDAAFEDRVRQHMFDCGALFAWAMKDEAEYLTRFFQSQSQDRVHETAMRLSKYRNW
jgi:hypothetical protein